MAKKKIPPGLAILRSSRMFSLPTSLPPPPSRNTFYETTTQTYPTSQSITTHHASRERGDWGFKRPLPLKTTTKSGQPYIRVKAVDTIEAITEFHSATDHTISVRKWAEMGVPITMPSQSYNSKDQVLYRSVFEDEYDVTDIKPGQAGKPNPSAERRWKFMGPNIAAMTEGQFQKYIKKNVLPEREAFREFLRKELAAQATIDRRMRDPSWRGKITGGNISDRSLMRHLRFLREHKRLLFDLVRKFLDLAPVAEPRSEPEHFLAELPTDRPKVIKLPNPYAVTGPPKTHPSVGMFYTRSKNCLDNSPLHGPQDLQPAFRFNVIRPKHPLGGGKAILGVGGFVSTVEVDFNNAGKTAKESLNLKALTVIDPKGTGMPKFWAQPAAAAPTSDGRLHITVLPPTSDSELVARERAGEVRHTDMHDPSRQSAHSMTKQMGARGKMTYPTIQGSRSEYGLGM